LPRCATIDHAPPKGVISDEVIQAIKARMRVQAEVVTSFYGTGRLSVKDWYWESEANHLVIGTRDPLRLRLEINHLWGHPILHILIEEKRLKVLSFQDSTLYVGSYSPESLSKFIPGSLEIHLIWSSLRGYPDVFSVFEIKGSRGNQIMLWKNNRESGVIHLHPEAQTPKRIDIHETFGTVSFSSFQENEGIRYAGEVIIENIQGKKDLVLKNSRMVFNRAFPQRLFRMEKPPDFKVRFLDEAFNHLTP
jgi:hypothetical protein